MTSVRDSRAGDDFHLLWAARRALALTDPRSTLRLVRLEGLNPADIEEGDDRFLGVDLTEYYGGESIPTASEVVVTQLKYSVRHSERNWTASRLATPVRRGRASVIRRLADIFGALVAEVHGDLEAVVSKVRIRLVTNQAAAPDLLNTLERAKSILTDLPIGTHTARAISELGVRQRASIAQLQARSGLSSPLFAGFLQVFDLSGCASDPRSLQRIHIAEEVGRLVVGPHTHGLPALLELVRSQVLPEAATSPGIRRVDVLAALGVASEEDLLPAPPRFAVVNHPIATPGPAVLAAQIVTASSRRTLAHGPAGIGKTTTLLCLEPLLPAGSAVVLYDCFGGGDYLSPGEERHTSGRALVQVANEISLRLGIAPLIYSGIASEADLWRRFSHRVAEAAETLPDGALLVLALDAADNAVYAASRRNERSFVPDLWEMVLPENVRLVMTCRTHRRAEVRPPAGAEECALQGFDAVASTAMLRRNFATASVSEGSVFHRRTQGVPRVQSYLLAANASDDLPRLLARSTKGLAEIFDDVFNAALVERADRLAAERQVATLYAMARPVRLATLADVLDIDMVVAMDIASSLEPGVVVTGDRLHFPDEDFDHYLRDRVSTQDLHRAHNALCDYYLSRRLTDDEAAATIPEHLRQAGRDDELILLALEEPLPMAIHDGLARAHAGRRRLRLAIDAASRVPLPELSIKLVLLAAQLARSDTSLTSVIRKRPELAAKFADPEAIAAVYVREESDPWLGPAHFRVASVLAWDEETKEAAREQVAHAQAWVRRWSSLDERDRRQWHVTADDLANGAAALWGLGGAEDAKAFLSRWRPPEVLAQAVPRLAMLVAQHESPQHVSRDLRRLRVPTWVQAQFVVALDRARKTPPKALVHRVARRLADIPADHSIFHRHPDWGIAFCEAAVRSGVPKRVGRALLARLTPPLPKFAPSDYDLSTQWREGLQAACLRAVLEGRDIQVDELLPDELRSSAEQKPGDYDPNASKRHSFKETLAPLLPLYKIRASSTMRSTGMVELAAVVRPTMRLFRRQAASRWFRGRQRYRSWVTIAVDTLAGASGDASDLLHELVDLADTVFSRTAALRVQVASSLVCVDTYREFALSLLDVASREVSSQAYSGTERRDILLDASSVAIEADVALAGDYFAGAVDAAQGIDDGVGLHLAVVARLAMGAGAVMQPEDARALAQRLARSIEAAAPFVSDTAEILPYSQVMLTVTDLDPPSAFALSSRWDDEDRLELSASLTIVVEHACERKWLEPEAGLWLLRLIHYDDAVVRTGIALLDILYSRGSHSRSKTVRCFNLLAEWVHRDVALHERVRLAKTLTCWAAAHGLDDLVSARRLRDLQEFVHSLNEQQTRSAHPIEERSIEPRPTLGEGSTNGADLTIEVQRLLDEYADEDDVARYLRGVLAASGPRLRTAALTDLVQLASDYPERRVVIGAVAAVLREAVEKWSGSAVVRQWAERSLPEYVYRHLPSLFKINAYRYGDWSTTLQTPFKLSVERLPSLLSATAARIEELSAAELFAVAEACAQLVDTTTKAAVVRWGLERVVPLEDSVFVTHPPCVRAEVLASFLWSLLGHPDKRVRWRAAHVARGLLSDLGDEVLAGALLGCLDAPPHSSFRAEGLDFFLFSAQMWTLLVLARVAGDTPDLLVDHSAKFAVIATDTTMPHAACREFARRTALRLSRHARSALSRRTVEALQLANRPASCHSARAHGYGRTDEPSDRDITRFHFDTMDTTRYWYEPLARVFGVDTDEIAKRADRWVTDSWGRTNEECYQDERRDRHEHEWALMSNDHGSLPMIESLRTYLEYHAMLVVAGELIDEGLPVLVEPYDDAPDPWDRWLRGHLDTDERCWLADRRAPTPLKSYCVGAVPDRSAFEGKAGAFDELLGVDGTDSLVVSGWIHTSNVDHYVHLRVMSALVSPESAAALLRALQTTLPNSFQLPYAGEGGGFHGNEIDEPGFRLLGWLDDIATRWDGLDDDDPLSVKIAANRTAPIDDFVGILGLTTDSTDCYFLDARGEVVVRIEIWSDEAGPGEREAVSRSSEGRRTWVRRDALLTYLDHRSLDLVIEVGVTMFGKSHPDWTSEDREQHGYDESRIYLFRRDGTLESLGGRPRFGPTDRERTWA